MMSDAQLIEYLESIARESKACGCLDIMLVPYGTEYFGELYAKGAIDNNPRCLACNDRMQLQPPAALVSFQATENPTACLPAPICRQCWQRFTPGDLMGIARDASEHVVDGLPIRFCCAE